MSADGDRIRRELDGQQQDLETHIETLKNEESALVGRIDALTAEEARLSKVSEDLEVIRGQRDETSAALEQAETELQSMSADGDRIKRELDDLRSNIASLKQAEIAAVTAREEAEASAEMARKNLDTLSTELAILEPEAAEDRPSLQSAREETLRSRVGREWPQDKIRDLKDEQQ